jgi:hypothetical protein
VTTTFSPRLPNVSETVLVKASNTSSATFCVTCARLAMTAINSVLLI